MVSPILDHTGRPFTSTRHPRQQLAELVTRQIRALNAKYDAAQTSDHNENHWLNSDNLDPHSANSHEVRKKLRARSRYEVVENNPYLKGICLTICNDFVGTGPRLQLTDKRLSKERKRLIEQLFHKWARRIKLRRKLWRMKLAKLVDGETFALFHFNPTLRSPVKLDLQVLEADRISTAYDLTQDTPVDGIKVDGFDNPLEYYLLDTHPGSSFYAPAIKGKWLHSSLMLHWFRQDRGWLRGIPELTPSLPLCALLRRYTIAVVRAAEVVASFSAVLETSGPPSTNAYTDGNGNLLEDDPFDVFPIEQGMFTRLPWGTQLKQLEAQQPTATYDGFVDSLLREIVRPVLVPMNRSTGSSSDSNMATAVVDEHLYKGGIQAERLDCTEEVLEPVFDNFWAYVSHIPELLDIPGESDYLSANPSLRFEPPDHVWRFDRVGVDHTDPLKVAKAIEVLHQNHFLTDRDIQESYYNRDLDEWQEEVLEQEEFRKKLTPISSPEEAGEEVDESEE